MSAFSDCRGLTSIIIPNSVTTIWDQAFSFCTGLTSVTIPNSVTEIGENAFSFCRGLTSITIPNSVTIIGGDAFYGCIGLASVTIGDSVTTIGNQAFFNCTGLTSITIPNSVTTIGNGAFKRCESLTSIYLMGDVPPIVGAETFTTTQYENAVLYVPKGTLATYQAAKVWKDFKNIREFDTTDIEEIATDDSHNGRSNTYYNLRGQAVEQPARGIYIYNGKKVFIK